LGSGIKTEFPCAAKFRRGVRGGGYRLGSGSRVPGRQKSLVSVHVSRARGRCTEDARLGTSAQPEESAVDSRQGVRQDFHQVAGAAAGAVGDLLPAGDTRGYNLPFWTFVLDCGEEPAVADGNGQLVVLLLVAE